MIEKGILGCEKFYRGERDAVLPLSGGYCNWKPEDGDVTRNNEFISLQSKLLRKFALQPIIGAIAARLARTKQIRILDDQIICKPPKSTKTTIGWHVDRAYWSICTSDNLLTAWIPFQDCDESWKGRSPFSMVATSGLDSEICAPSTTQTLKKLKINFTEKDEKSLNCQ